MGVKGLWKILGPVKEIVSIESLRGKVLAVDLAVWVVQSETVTNNACHGIYLRQLFYKVNHLLEHGIGIIIVTDGKAPLLKAQTIANRLGVQLDRNSKVIQRRRFLKIMRECEAMCTALGIPVLKGASEAEASAAKLQQDGLVDGVITTDGDAFLYGARQVYRNVLVTEKYCERYDMERVESELGLSRDDLIGLGILNGCDYNPEGVPGLGPATALNYILNRERLRSVTDELVSWSKQTQEISAKYEQLKGIRAKPHCSWCKHQGSKKEHTLTSCPSCGPQPGGGGCLPKNSIPCECTKHVAERLLVSPHMQCCIKLTRQCRNRQVPVSEIVEEFRNYRANASIAPSWQLPPCNRFVNFMLDQLEWRKVISAAKFAHIASLHHISQKLEFVKSYPLSENRTLQFNHILKKRTKDKVEMYELEYTVLDGKLKELLEFDIVYSIMDAKFVELLLPEAVEEFKSREKQPPRKKKENILQIYDRYPISKPAVQTKQTARKTATAKTKIRANKKEVDILSEDLNKLQIISKSSSVEDVTSAATDDTLNSSGDDYVPLSERLALRRANTNSTEQYTVLSDRTGSNTSLSSLEYDHVPTADIQVSSPVRHKIQQEYSDSNVQDGDVEGHVDSNVQLLPQNFMDDYLDLSRDEILGISREQVSRESTNLSSFADRENSFEVTESVASEEYRHVFEDNDYHTLFFTTPSAKSNGEKGSVHIPHKDVTLQNLDNSLVSETPNMDEDRNGSIRPLETLQGNALLGTGGNTLLGNVMESQDDNSPRNVTVNSEDRVSTSSKEMRLSENRENRGNRGPSDTLSDKRDNTSDTQTGYAELVHEKEDEAESDDVSSRPSENVRDTNLGEPGINVTDVDKSGYVCDTPQKNGSANASSSQHSATSDASSQHSATSDASLQHTATENLLFLNTDITPLPTHHPTQPFTSTNPEPSVEGIQEPNNETSVERLSFNNDNDNHNDNYNYNENDNHNDNDNDNTTLSQLEDSCSYGSNMLPGFSPTTPADFLDNNTSLYREQEPETRDHHLISRKLEFGQSLTEKPLPEIAGGLVSAALLNSLNELSLKSPAPFSPGPVTTGPYSSPFSPLPSTLANFSPLPSPELSGPAPHLPSPLPSPELSWPAPHLPASQISQPPDLSFLREEVVIKTPGAWRKKPLSDIKFSSTPKSREDVVITSGLHPLPDIQPDIQPDIIQAGNFNINITELLEEPNN